LVDSFNVPDWALLNSSLGKYDGNCYQDMFDRTQNKGLNKSHVLEPIKQIVLPWIAENAIKPRL